jgi:hypothetical protein
LDPRTRDMIPQAIDPVPVDGRHPDAHTESVSHGLRESMGPSQHCPHTIVEPGGWGGTRGSSCRPRLASLGVSRTVVRGGAVGGVAHGAPQVGREIKACRRRYRLDLPRKTPVGAMLDDGAAEPAGEDARKFGAPLVGAHAARVTPVVRLDVVVVVHGHHGDPAKRGPSVMSYDVFGRVLREGMTRGSTGAGRVASHWRIDRQHRPLRVSGGRGQWARHAHFPGATRPKLQKMRSARPKTSRAQGRC